MENRKNLTAWEKMQLDMIYDDFDEDLFWRRVDAKNIRKHQILGVNMNSSEFRLRLRC